MRGERLDCESRLDRCNAAYMHASSIVRKLLGGVSSYGISIQRSPQGLPHGLASPCLPS
jgi:hypothetical protein